MKKFLPIFLLLVVIGCHKIDKGVVVVAKWHVDAHTTLMPMRVGKIITLMPIHRPERWMVRIKNIAAEADKDNEYGAEAEWEIAKELYDRTNINDYIEIK